MHNILIEAIKDNLPEIVKISIVSSCYCNSYLVLRILIGKCQFNKNYYKSKIKWKQITVVDIKEPIRREKQDENNNNVEVNFGNV